jgi:hypothetical protein
VNVEPWLNQIITPAATAATAPKTSQPTRSKASSSDPRALSSGLGPSASVPAAGLSELAIDATAPF